jgi:hypothetical protein
MDNERDWLVVAVEDSTSTAFLLAPTEAGTGGTFTVRGAKLAKGFWIVRTRSGLPDQVQEAHIGDFLRIGFPVPGMAEVTRTVERVVKKYGPTVKEWLESTRQSGPDTFGRVAESPTTIAVNRGEPNTDEVAELSRQFPDVKFTKAEATGDGT